MDKSTPHFQFYLVLRQSFRKQRPCCTCFLGDRVSSALLARKVAEGGERIHRRRLWERRTINPSGNHTNKIVDNEVLLPGGPGGTVNNKILPVSIYGSLTSDAKD